MVPSVLYNGVITDNQPPSLPTLRLRYSSYLALYSIPPPLRMRILIGICSVWAHLNKYFPNPIEFEDIIPALLSSNAFLGRGTRQNLASL